MMGDDDGTENKRTKKRKNERMYGWRNQKKESMRHIKQEGIQNNSKERPLQFKLELNSE